ncbi:MAG TPA: DNA recombination protein RmuC [Candidatus Krumholzibacteria bacterium]|nr:DNA recombination protein RmuC [Candidatus Krumholzibacteria bacterium]
MSTGITVALALGVVVGFSAAWLIARSRAAALRAQNEGKDRALAARDEAVVDLKVQVARLESTLEQERASETRLSNAFKALSADALKSSNESFLELAKATLEKYQAGAKNDLEQRAKSVEEFVKPLKESLEKVNVQIETIEKTRREDYGSLSQHLMGLRTETSSLNTETRNLTNALRTPIVRGRWGEVQLRKVVELAGMVEYCDFVEQPSVEGEEGRLRPDLVVNLPGGKNVVVDSKVPLEAYLNAQESTDVETARAYMKDHARQIRVHIGKLRAKSYAEQFDSTPEFVVMFLPGESFFSAALEHEPGLIEEGAAQNVIIATPTTLIALLRSVAYGWKQEKIAESAQEIRDLGIELHKRMRVLAEHVMDIGDGLNRAVGAYNKSVGSLESSVLPAARRFPELGLTGQPEIPQLTPVERTTRALNSPELSLFTLHEKPNVIDAADAHP